MPNRSPENHIDKLINFFADSVVIRYILDMLVMIDQFWLESLIDSVQRPYERISGLQIEEIPRQLQHLIDALVRDLNLEIYQGNPRRMRLTDDPKIIKILYLGSNDEQKSENPKRRPSIKIMVIVDDHRQYFYFPGEMPKSIQEPQRHGHNILAKRLDDLSQTAEIDLHVISESDVLRLKARAAGIMNRMKTDAYQQKVLSVLRELRRGIVVYDLDQQSN